jgi:hypothetical protein
MSSHGFEFVPLDSGHGSGGPFASGEFRREREGEVRRVEMHFRLKLGLVSYHVNGSSLSHSDYMRALAAKNQYPGFSDDPLDGFRHLLHDLTEYAQDFLDGPGEAFRAAVTEAERRETLTGFQRMSESA